jgi:hypothetical protein
MAAKVHPELLQQMARAGSAPVQAIVHLRSTQNAKIIPTADDSVKLAHEVLDRVAGQVGHRAGKVNVLRHLATVVLEADPEFVRSLLLQPEVVSALPNQSADSPFIPPTKKRPLNSSEMDAET